MTPRIAILGWGSLNWRIGCLRLASPWQLGGPVLPIEFSRVSNDKRLTLVIDEQSGQAVPTRYALSACASLEQARLNLQTREETPFLDRIGYVDLRSGACSAFAQQQHPDACRVIEAWGRGMHLDAVVWTALGPNFQERNQGLFSISAALQHLEGLSGEARAKAFEYFAKAPLEVMTPLRRALAQSH